MGYEGDFSRTYDQLDLAGIGRAAARRAVAGLGGRQIPTRRGPVLLENSVAAEFLETAAGSFLADNVHKGKSILAGRQGKKIMSRAVTIVDDGLRPGGLVTAPADAEGTPRQTTTVVENGELKTFLYDAQRAAVDHAGSTGNAVRGGAKAPPGLGTTNFIIRPGEKSLEEMMAELRAGLFVTEAMGVHTADPISGDFSFGVSGLLIQGGGIAHPVKGVALAGNVFDMFENVLRVGADLRLFGSTGAPSLLVDGLTVSGS
jgi:PmbA protein